jgi:hypothetical protein
MNNSVFLLSSVVLFNRVTLCPQEAAGWPLDFLVAYFMTLSLAT